MFRQISAILLAILPLFSSPAWARQSALTDPAPIDIPAGRSDAEVMRAVRFAVATRGWTVDQEEAGKLVAAYSPQRYVARVEIKVAGGKVSIGYLDSTNLNFEQNGGEREIHPSYNKWVAQLGDEVARRVKEGVAEDAAVPQVAGGQASNPPPKEKFSNFGRFEVADVAMGPPYAGQPANDAARANLVHALDLKLAPLVARWNAGAAASARVLRIETTIKDIRFIGTAARIFTGKMAGHSYVVLGVRYVDAATSQAVAEPEFYFAASGNGWTGSAQDYHMLEDAGAAVANYTQANYNDVVGGGIRPPARR